MIFYLDVITIVHTVNEDNLKFTKWTGRPWRWTTLEVHKMDGITATKWTDHQNGEYRYKSIKWTVQPPQSERISHDGELP